MPIVIVDYRFANIACRTGRNTTGVIQIQNQWIVEGYIERHAGFRYPPKTYSREDRHILRSVLKNYPITSRNINQEFGIFALYPIFA